MNALNPSFYSRGPVASLRLAALLALATSSHAQQAPAEAAAGLDALRTRLAEQRREIDVLERSLAEQTARLAGLRHALDAQAATLLYAPTGKADQAAPSPGAVPLLANAAADVPAGTSVDNLATVPRSPAPIFEQPGVLTPRDGFVFEPSLQYAYASSNRIALVGYTVIPAILVGLIDVREIKRTTFTGALTARYGLTNRFEVEAKVPYVSRSDISVGREVLQGASADSAAFNAHGHGLGDIEMTARYQFNDGGADRPYYIGSLRLKSRTGEDPFEVGISRSLLGFRNDGLQTRLPTGSGFYGIQPAITALFPSDPAVFFGTLSYLHSVRRSHLSLNTDEGLQEVGEVAPGGIFGLNFGIGLALNDKTSFSIGYDHSAVARTRQNGAAAADAVPLQLGTLLLGYSYRLDARRSLNVSLGAGLTRDTPDVTATVRLPMTF